MREMREGRHFKKPTALSASMIAGLKGSVVKGNHLTRISSTLALFHHSRDLHLTSVAIRAAKASINSRRGSTSFRLRFGFFDDIIQVEPRDPRKIELHELAF
jgi:hypothetical protein